MVLITYLNPKVLKNESDLVFQNRVAGIAEVLPVDAKMFVSNHKQALEALIECRKTHTIKTKDLTEQIVAKVKEIYSTWQTAKQMLQALTNLMEADKKQTAIELLSRFKKAGTLYRYGRVQQMGRIKILLKDISEVDCSSEEFAHVNKLVENLQTLLAQAEDLYNQRSAVKAAVVKAEVANCRAKVDQAYIELVNYANAMATYSTEEKYQQFAATVNLYVLEAKQKHTALSDDCQQPLATTNS